MTNIFGIIFAIDIFHYLFLFSLFFPPSLSFLPSTHLPTHSFTHAHNMYPSVHLPIDPPTHPCRCMYCINSFSPTNNFLDVQVFFCSWICLYGCKPSGSKLRWCILLLEREPMKPSMEVTVVPCANKLLGNNFEFYHSLNSNEWLMLGSPDCGFNGGGCWRAIESFCCSLWPVAYQETTIRRPFLHRAWC